MEDIHQDIGGQADQGRAMKGIQIAALYASACAYSSAISICSVIYIDWGGDPIFSADGTIRIYRIAALLLICFAAITGAHHYLSRVAVIGRSVMALLAGASGLGMTTFIHVVDAATFKLVFPGLCILGAFAIITGALTLDRKGRKER